jgi:hypothetical protein
MENPEKENIENKPKFIEISADKPTEIPVFSSEKLELVSKAMWTDVFPINAGSRIRTEDGEKYILCFDSFFLPAQAYTTTGQVNAFIQLEKFFAHDPYENTNTTFPLNISLVIRDNVIKTRFENGFYYPIITRRLDYTTVESVFEDGIVISQDALKDLKFIIDPSKSPGSTEDNISDEA